MKEILEKAKELVKMLEEKETEGQAEQCMTRPIQLAELKPGDKFSTGIGKFIVLEQMDGQTKITTQKLYKENVEFGDCTDYKKSALRELCDTEILADFEKEFGSDNIIEHTADLTTLDGQKCFGIVDCKVRPMTFDEARKYNEFLVNKDLPDWYWTCTPWSTKERGWEYSISVVSPSGNFNNFSFIDDFGVRPFCILKSNIFVSLED